MQPQTDEMRGKRVCVLTATGSTSNAMKRLIGGAAQGSAVGRRHRTAALIPRSSGIGTHPTSAEWAEAARIAWSSGMPERDEGAEQVSLRCRMSNCRL